MPEPTTQQIIDAHKESITHWEHNLKTFPRHQQIDWLFFNGMTSSCPLCTIFLTAQSDCAGCSLDDQLVAGCSRCCREWWAIRELAGASLIRDENIQALINRIQRELDKIENLNLEVTNG